MTRFASVFGLLEDARVLHTSAVQIAISSLVGGDVLSTHVRNM